ncbi:DUF996 domain-containing protein [Vulcanisaeta sp. JCM 16159]|uniref:DUF996 domain-containing protein n=1 Tax=Vulcanisaeta sp. JCM 16159 TaxID=1295371 RepID=UPI0006D2183B|nr:DUF996 domain-containing protein [Vulcanisaeta sp. JCM 16159]
MSEDLKTAGTLGLIGSILAIIPDVDIVGYILLLIALNKASKAYGNDAIWSNALKALIIAIVGGILGTLIAVLFVSIFAIFNAAFSGSATAATASIIGILAAAYALIVVSGYFWKNAYIELARSSNINDFQRAAKWIWLGALLTIILVGIILYIIGLAYSAAGFNKLR